MIGQSRAGGERYRHSAALVRNGTRSGEPSVVTFQGSRPHLNVAEIR